MAIPKIESPRVEAYFEIRLGNIKARYMHKATYVSRSKASVTASCGHYLRRCSR